MATQTSPRQTPAIVQGVAGLATFITLALLSASLFESSGDSLLGIGRVLVSAGFYSLLLYQLFQGLGKIKGNVTANAVTALVVAELTFSAVVVVNLFWADSAILATEEIYLLGFALLVFHLAILIINGQKKEVSGR